MYLPMKLRCLTQKFLCWKTMDECDELQNKYNVIFIVLDESYQNLLYGLDFGKEPEFIINLNEYIEEDFTVLNANIDESGNIFTILGTEKLRYGATEIYKFEPKK